VRRIHVEEETCLSIQYAFKDFVGKNVLITGDVGVGKTKLTITLLEEAVALGLSDKITIIDMAPATVFIEGRKIGGKLVENFEKLRILRYLTPQRVETPRLSAKSTRELLHLVDLNEKRIRPLLKEFVATPTSILFVNDISIYLQSGFDESILSVMRSSETFVANGYYGSTLKSDFETDVSATERRLMKKLANTVDIVINL
jgi:hypothetical protein